MIVGWAGQSAKFKGVLQCVLAPLFGQNQVIGELVVLDERIDGFSGK
jgi:hypothetical protein